MKPSTALLTALLTSALLPTAAFAKVTLDDARASEKAITDSYNASIVNIPKEGINPRRLQGVPSNTWIEIWHGSTQGIVPTRVPANAKEVYIIANGRGFTIPVNSHSTLIEGRGSYSGHVVRGAGATQTGHSGRCVHTSTWTSGGDNGRIHHSCDKWEHPGHTIPAVNIQSVQVKY
ncbi:hypothetical protein L1D34_11245 [Vibrio mediterranei]|uniref:hypothetical protein n=1 Tax=Vibrio mediterranei TaxID=689 RepID=UPI001EFD239B|nr:hypothetical protein [Vibrio mediterranei]MCG9625420.1 hypothetical protein [Vibrio mediterranei]